MTEDEKLTYILKKIQVNNNGETIEFVIPKILSKKIVAYQSLREDLIFCRNAIELLNNKELEVTYKMSLYYSFIAIYGKCFTDASKSKSPQLEVSDFGTLISKFDKLHNEIMNMRHNYISHRGLSEDDFGVGIFSLNKKTLAQRIYVNQIKRKSFDIEKIEQIKELIDTLIKISESKFQKASLKVKKHLLGLNPEELSKCLLTLP
jgi:hypothetical protein